MRSLVISGEVPFDEPLDPAILQVHLLDNLRDIEARNIESSGRDIEFTGGYFRAVTNWNILVPFGFGSLTVDSQSHRVRYRLSYRQTIIFNAVTLVVLEMFCGFVCTPPAVEVMLVLPFIFLFASFISVFTGRARFERFLRRAIRSCPAALTSGSRG